MSRVTLIRPPNVMAKQSLVNALYPPIGLAYLASALRQGGFDVSIIDALGEDMDRFEPAHRPDIYFNGLRPEEIVNRIPADSKIIGLQIVYTQNYVFTKHLIKLIRERFREALLVAGGEHINALPEESLKDCLELDVCCLGESEESLVELTRAYFEKKDFSSIAGIVFRNGSELTRTPKRPRMKDPDQIPWPAWDLIPVANYLDRKVGSGPNFGRRLPMITSRGCPYRCTFCTSEQMWGPIYMTRKPELVVEEITWLVTKYKLDAIEIVDLTMAVNRTWFHKFLLLLKEANLGIKWSMPSGTRSEILDEEILTLLKETGCTFFALAPESGSQRSLEKIKKKVSLPHLAQALKTGSRLGMTIKMNIIVGFPFETRRDIFATFKFLMKSAFFGAQDGGVNIFRAYPGTQLFKELMLDGRVGHDDETYDDINFAWDIFSFKRKTFCRNIASWELKLYRLVLGSAFYLATYVLRPARIIRSFINIFSGRASATLFEERLSETIQRLKKRTA
jgi:anaerobic magnesium-protoporphyrin IX monomethyl ester cyclase